jgi:hypothetical protein
MARDIPMTFDGWWMQLTKKRPDIKPHMKEIIWADFRARKLTDKETLFVYNDALKKFGW